MIRTTIFERLKLFLPQPKIEKNSEVSEKVIDEVSGNPATPLFHWSDFTDTPKTKDRGQAHGRRKWSQITGITLHQTAVDFGTNPKRLLNVPVHGGTLQDGQIVLIHDPTDYMWHAHALNKKDIGIEISCRAAGIEGMAATFWRSQSEKEKGKSYGELVKEASDEQLEAAKELCRYYIKLVKENGGEIKFIHAHRQGHKSRISDPGSRIWQKVAIPIMGEFGLTTGPIGWRLKTGNPIPQAWDPVHGKGIKYTSSIRGF
jgi:hypothetical protein